MNTFEPFTVPVNEAGLPHNYRAPEGIGNITNLSTQEIANLYWLIDKIHLSLEWEVNTKKYSKEFTLKTQKSPLERLTGPELLRNKALKFGPIMQLNGQYSYNFSLYLENFTENWLVTTEKMSNFILADKYIIPNLNIPPIYLWIKNGSGKIINTKLNIIHKK